MLYLTSSYDFENNFKFCCQDAVDLWWIDMVLLSLTQISNTFSKTQFSLLDIFDDEKIELFLLLNRFKLYDSLSQIFCVSVCLSMLK